MWWLAEIIAGVVLLFHGAGLLHAGHALMRARTSQGSIAWIMALVFMPYFAVPRYVRFMEHLPKTPTERVRKVELRELPLDDGVYDRVKSGPEIKA